LIRLHSGRPAKTGTPEKLVKSRKKQRTPVKRAKKAAAR
jgi:hypothetical protein